MHPQFDPDTLRRCYYKLADLHRGAQHTEEAHRETLKHIPQQFLESAKNLLHYMALRKHDIRHLQMELGYMGLSSLGRLEAHVLAGLEFVLAAIKEISDDDLELVTSENTFVNFRQGDELLAHHTELLLGPRPAHHMPRIMVTMPSQAASDYQLVRSLLKTGMNVARINSAHDSQEQWTQMVANVRKASKDLDRPCRILFDLGGPKLRTGVLEKTSASIKIKSAKKPDGGVLRPAKLRLMPQSSGQHVLTYQKGDIIINDLLFGALQTGDQLQLKDARNKKRMIRILEVTGNGVLAESMQTILLKNGVQLQHTREGKSRGIGAICALPGIQSYISLVKDDFLLVTGPDTPGRHFDMEDSDRTNFRASIPCTLPEVFEDIQPGERIFFDDGKIAGLVEHNDGHSLSVRITRTEPGGSRLRSDKGINLPDSRLQVAALSGNDLDNLHFAVHHVDIVGLSFVRDGSDVELLHRKMKSIGNKIPGIVLKIETAAGFDNLFNLLLTGLRYPPLGVMVARGDLGVELGFDRMAEVQEQILWLCEAAHVPVIWATQVLEQMTKTGMPTRGEVTDAAMSARAECVMLNKGPFIVQAVQFLDDILSRMQDHNHKKTPMLRKLKISEGRWAKPDV